MDVDSVAMLLDGFATNMKMEMPPLSGNERTMALAKANDADEMSADEWQRACRLDGLAYQGFSPYVDATQIGTLETGKPPNVLTFAEIRHQFQSENKELIKRIVRENAWPVNAPIRVRLWPALCALHQKRGSNAPRPETMKELYWQMVQTIFGSTKLAEQPISLPMFVDATHCLPYHLNANGRAVADRIVTVLAYDYPGITYCPLLYPLTALMLHYVNEENTYCAMVLLISSRSKMFMSQTKAQHDSTRHTVLELARQRARNTVRYFERVQPCLMLEQIFNEWCWWILAGLPFAHVVRIMDCYLNEGFKIFYRVVFVVLQLFGEQVNQCNILSTLNSELLMSNAIFNFCHRITITPEKLLHECFKIRRLSAANITRIFTAHERRLRDLHYSMPFRTSPPRHDSIQSASETFSEPWHRYVFTLWSWLPDRFAVYKPRVLFTIQKHGYGLQKFYERVEHHEPTLLLIRSTTLEVFGAFCSSRWAERHQLFNEAEGRIFFGTGETFLFTLHPTCKKYPWVGISHNVTTPATTATNCFMGADQHMINIGCEGLWLDGSLRVGRTDHCNTFNNQPLCAACDFKVKNFEVYGFVDA